MEFMITFNHVEGVWDRLSEAERGEHETWLAGFVKDLAKEKSTKLGFVMPPEHRKTVRKHSDGSVEDLDGPAIPGPEQVGGYYIIDAESVEEAVEWAKKGRWLVGANEVRQIFSPPS